MSPRPSDNSPPRGRGASYRASGLVHWPKAVIADVLVTSERPDLAIVVARFVVSVAQCGMPPRDDLAARTGALFLYPFRARNPLTGKWYKARYLAERHEIAARYAEWEIIGLPEIRHPGGAAFDPWR